MNNWDERYLKLAFHVAEWSKDPSTQVGACIAKNNRIVSLGFNGIPTGLDDDSYLSPRETKIACVIHAEMNAIFNANIPLADTTLYVTGAPCSNCAASMIQAGIKRIVMPHVDKEFAKRWNYHLSEKMFEEVGVEVVELDGEKKIVHNHTLKFDPPDSKFDNPKYGDWIENPGDVNELPTELNDVPAWCYQVLFRRGKEGSDIPASLGETNFSSGFKGYWWGHRGTAGDITHFRIRKQGLR